MPRWTLLFTLLIAVFACYSVFHLATHRRTGPPQPIILFGWLGAHWLLKLLWTIEACRPLNEDRHAGALELILCTAVRPGDMIRAQGRRLFRVFLLPIATVVFANYLDLLSSADRILETLFLVGLVTLPVDCWALRWTSVHFSLAGPSLIRAAFSSLWRVLVPPWIAGFLIMLLLAAGHASESVLRVFLVWWGLGVVVYDCFVVVQKKRLLAATFRRLAAGERRSPAPARPEQTLLRGTPAGARA